MNKTKKVRPLRHPFSVASQGVLGILCGVGGTVIVAKGISALASQNAGKAPFNAADTFLFSLGVFSVLCSVFSAWLIKNEIDLRKECKKNPEEFFAQLEKLDRAEVARFRPPSGLSESVIGSIGVGALASLLVMVTASSKLATTPIQKELVTHGFQMIIPLLGVMLFLTHDGVSTIRRNKARQELAEQGKHIPIGLLYRQEIENIGWNIADILKRYDKEAFEYLERTMGQGPLMQVEEPDGKIISGGEKFRRLYEADMDFILRVREEFFRDGKFDLKAFEGELRNRKSRYGELIVSDDLFQKRGGFADGPELEQ